LDLDHDAVNTPERVVDPGHPELDSVRLAGLKWRRLIEPLPESAAERLTAGRNFLPAEDLPKGPRAFEDSAECHLSRGRNKTTARAIPVISGGLHRLHVARKSQGSVRIGLLVTRPPDRVAHAFDVEVRFELEAFPLRTLGQRELGLPDLAG